MGESLFKHSKQGVMLTANNNTAACENTCDNASSKVIKVDVSKIKFRF